MDSSFLWRPLLAVFAAACGTIAAPQGEPDYSRRADEGEVQAIGGLGITDSPDTFLAGGQVDFYVAEEIAVGPKLQLGVDSNDVIFAPSVNVKKVFPIVDGARQSRWRPFVQGGLGLAWMREERRNGKDDDLGIMLSAGGGVEVFLNEKVSLGAGLDLNILPGEVLDESTFLSLRLIEMGVRF